MPQKMSVPGEEENMDQEAELRENPVHAGDSTDSLKAACEKTWSEIRQIHQQLKETHQPQSTVQTPGQQPLIAILKEKERLLKAEIQSAKDSAVFTLPNDTQALTAALKEDLEKKVGQLREMRSLVSAQEQELRASIEREKQFEEQLNTVHDKLEEKCQMLDLQEPTENSLEAVAQELETNINAAHKVERTIMKKMAAFVSKHFPMPDQDQVSHGSRQLQTRHKTSQDILPLKDILLDLMTRSVESPEEPYVTLDERHWPAYIELLLRCNIVLRHPDDDRRIKLASFQR